MTEREAQILIADQLGLSVVSIPNVGMPVGGWSWYEADLIYFRPKSGYLTEVEIKLDYQDFVHDFEKKHYHDDRDVKYFYYAFSPELWESRKDDILDVLADKNPDAGIMTVPTPAFPNLIVRHARPRNGVDRLTPERQMKYMRIGAYKWWKRHAEEVIRRCIEDEYREDDVNAMGRCE